MALSDGQRKRKQAKQATISKKRRNKHTQETRNEDGTIKIPEYVKNKEAWLEYIKLYDEVHKDEQLYMPTSDPEVQVSLLATPYRVRQAIEHLPQDEQVEILAKSSRLRSLQAQAATKKREALGDNYSRHGHEEGEEEYNQYKNFFEKRYTELIEYFGRFFTLEEVFRVVNYEWGHKVTMKAIGKWRLDNIDKINARQEEFKKDFSDIRLGYKKSRLEELTYLYNTRKAVYNEKLKVDDGRELRGILEQVRKEVEGDTLLINGNINHSHEILIKSQVTDNMMKGLNLKSMILSRVAAKLNINPIALQYQLANSWYAKFTGFAPADNNINTDEIIYPSSFIYDFEDLKRKNTAVMAEDAEIVELMEPKSNEEQKQTAADIKAQMLKKLMDNRTLNTKTKEVITHKRINDGNSKKA